jgi:hypothetical protein
MEARVYCDLLEMLTVELPTSKVREILEQSLLACEARNWKQVSALSQNATMWARTHDDRIGEATALIHQGIASAQLKRPDIALDVCGRAKRIFCRDPDWRHRMGEGLAAFALGLLYDSSVEALKHYSEALRLLGRLEERFAAEGDKRRQQDVHTVCDLLHLKISHQIPVVCIDEKPYILTLPAGRDEMILELQVNAEYLVMPVKRDEYIEFGLSSDDSVLVRRIRQIDEIESGGLGVWYETGGEYYLGKFERDDQGNVQFVQPDGKVKSIGASEVNSAGCVDAILKPT